MPKSKKYKTRNSIASTISDFRRSLGSRVHIRDIWRRSEVNTESIAKSPSVGDESSPSTPQVHFEVLEHGSAKPDELIAAKSTELTTSTESTIVSTEATESVRLQTSDNSQTTVRPITALIRVPSSRVLEALGVALADLETVLNTFPSFERFRSVITGIRICAAQTELVENAQLEYEDIVLDLTSLVRSIQSEIVQLKEIDISNSVQGVNRDIQGLITRIKISQEHRRSEGTKPTDLLVDQEITRYRDIVVALRRLCTDMQANPASTRERTPLESVVINQQNPVAFNAQYNAILPTEIRGRHGCTPGTCLEILDTITKWAKMADGPRIFWITGAAGTGKTTIAHSICQRLDDEQPEKKQLGASFFCSSAFPGCRDASRIIPTIAYQLMRFSEKYWDALFKHLWFEPEAVASDLVIQFNRFLVMPFTKARDMLPNNTVVVIDAIDECIDIDGMQTILELLLRHADDLPIKFLITSRVNHFAILGPSPGEPSPIHFYNAERASSRSDIELYLANILSAIIPPRDLTQLSTLAESLFIFAVTTRHYLLPDFEGTDSRQRLSSMLDISANLGDARYFALDKLYTIILSSALNDKDPEELKSRQLVLWTIVCAKEPMTATTIAELLGLSHEDVLLAVLMLEPVLHLNDTTGVVSLRHITFREFILDPKRSEKYYCDEAQHNGFLAARCFTIMKTSLQFNICGLETSANVDADVPNLQYRVAKAISPVLSDACCYWADYLEKSALSDRLIEHLDDFLQRRLLFWMEVLNLKKWIGKGEIILLQLINWLLRANSLAELHKFSQDALDFVKNYSASPASHSAPHIYISALPFASRQSRIYDVYWPQTQGLFVVGGRMSSARLRKAPLSARISKFGPYIFDVQLTRAPVFTSVAFSPDGTRVVSGSQDGVMCCWRTDDGSQVLGPIKAHAERIRCVAFSSDGTSIVSGSYDGTIRAWDANTGSSLPYQFTGHNGPVLCIAFSPDDTQVLSGAMDCTIQMFDLANGSPAEGVPSDNNDPVRVVAFSPDGWLALSADGARIRLWDSRDGTIIQSFAGHTGIVRSAAFSPNGKRVASGTAYGEILVWDAYSGTQLVGPFKGHTEIVSSVAFSPDGRILASSSYDRDVRLWDAYRGTTLAPPFKEHWANVLSVVFFHGGNRVMSGSKDGTIHHWDIQALDAAQNRYSWKKLNIKDWVGDIGGGWVKDSKSQRAVWVPPDYIAKLHDSPYIPIIPPCSLVIHPDRAVFANFRGALIGERWRECYVGPTDTDGI
ncbi:hypothetical protein OPQ81_009636 [Rhizoctonia solani]|nr:hypothetical protein OPQ81_009636 [Rhizoctonia solani]